MIRVAILGTGRMAEAHLLAYRAMDGVDVVAVCDVDSGRAAQFAEKHSVKRIHASLSSLLADKTVEAVSNVTPDAVHASTSCELLLAGKHVLCEKPLTLSVSDAQRMVAAAETSHRVNAVNFSYRGAAAVHHAAYLIGAGHIGELRHVNVAYRQSWLVSEQWGVWHQEPAFLWRASGGAAALGTLGDIGVHILDFVTLAAGQRIRDIACRLDCFDKWPGGEKDGYRFDANDSFVATAHLESGALCCLQASRWATGFLNTITLELHGTRGAIAINLDQSWEKLRLCAGSDVHATIWRSIDCPPVPTVYQRFIEAIRTGRPASPDFARGLEIQRLLGACFDSHQTNSVPQHLQY